MIDSALHVDALDWIVQALLGAVLVWVGYVFLSIDHLFGTSASFSVMAKYGTETAWGGGLALAGFIGIAGLLPWLRRLRLSSLIVLSAFHTNVAVFFSLGAFPSTASGVYTAMALLGLVLVAREAAQ